jgi:hypothetical protein
MQPVAGWQRCGRAWRRRAWRQQLPMAAAGVAAAAARGPAGAMTGTGVLVQLQG